MTTVKTLFFIRREKTDKDTKTCPIYLRITCGKRTEISLWVQFRDKLQLHTIDFTFKVDKGNEAAETDDLNKHSEEHKH